MADELIKDTAKALVYITGMAFDVFAFEDSGLSEEEINDLVKEIEKFCRQGISRLQKKHGISIPITSSDAVIDAMLFE